MRGVALITGASSGIGLAAAEALRYNGFKVHAGVRKSSDQARMTERGFTPMILDVRNEEQMRDAVADAERAGGIEVLVNSAGYGIMGPMEELDMAVLREQFEVNVFGLLRMSQLVLPAMRRRRTGRIIHIGSVGGLFTTPGAGAYHMTKYAVESLTDAMRAEVSGFGVQVAVVEPTGVKTRFVATQIATSPADKADAPYSKFKVAWARMAAGLFEGAASTTVPVEEVARAITHAATAARPRTRYPVGLVAKVGPKLRRITPDRLWDRAMLRQIGIIPGAPDRGDSRHKASGTAAI